LAFAFGSNAASAQWRAQVSGTSAGCRGVSAVSPAVAWAGCASGTYLRTTDGGATWRADTVPGASALDFRDVHGVDENTAYLMSAGERDASRIYKTTDAGRHWTLQYSNASAGVFFDAIAFWDADHGVAVSDPVGGRFLVITTGDGGATWSEVSAEHMPPALPGEAAFAASGTCLVVQGKGNAWFGTGGGSVARVFRSTDRGRTWTVAPAPVMSGNPSSGIFSLAFSDARHGVAVGGDYSKARDASAPVVARTTDGGRTWTPVRRGAPAGFRSGVAYIPGTGGRMLVAVGLSGSDRSADGGAHWAPIDTVGYHAVSFARSADAGWAVGAGGRVAKWAGRR
jgi:photosystem II stability/assembly factor-like uncharacterized protein